MDSLTLEHGGPTLVLSARLMQAKPLDRVTNTWLREHKGSLSELT